MSMILAGLGIAARQAPGIIGTIQARKTRDANIDIANRNLRLQQDTLQWQKDAWQTQMDREDTAMQRQVADLRAAGLHPGFAMGGSGASAGAAPPVEAPQQAKEQGTAEAWLEWQRNLNDLATTEAQRDLLRAQARQANATAEATSGRNTREQAMHDIRIEIERITSTNEVRRQMLELTTAERNAEKIRLENLIRREGVDLSKHQVAIEAINRAIAEKNGIDLSDAELVTANVLASVSQLKEIQELAETSRALVRGRGVMNNRGVIGNFFDLVLDTLNVGVDAKQEVYDLLTDIIQNRIAPRHRR